MKKINILKHQSLAYVLLAILMVFVSVVPTIAEGTISAVIDLSEIKNEKFVAEQHKFKYWFVSEEKISEEAQKLEKKTLDDMTEAALDEKYPEFYMTDKPGEDKKVALVDLKEGTYYFRDMVEDEASPKLDSFYVVTPLAEDQNTIKPVLVEEKPEAPIEEAVSGKVVVKLISEDGKALQGGGFELYEKKDSGLTLAPLKDGAYDLNGKKGDRLTTNEKGEITVYKLPAGTYLMRQIKSPAGYQMIKEENEFTITDKQVTMLEVVNKSHLKIGEHHFLKYDKANNALLEGAIFKVTTYDKSANKYIAVSRDGKDYTITSGKKGQFSAVDLPYGTYYLVEVQSPKGYKLSKDPIKFTIDEQSHKTRTDIANEKLVVSGKNGSSTGGGSKSSNSKGKIPKTGDIVFPVLAFSGVALAVVGRALIKRDDE